MAQATLKHMLTKEELESLYHNVEFNLNAPLKDLSWKQLSQVGLTLLFFKYRGRPVPSVNIAAEAINILTERAIEKKLDIF